ncbi:SDR family NAD(P)-dependent oxidoreductase [Natronomonas marina]|jgi:NAD(P)-dependent dehydrogenase (short-subunit alcohol dehydrogenase family)|uniref:SDR family NAD(P)-dependent oxidoreductase n=1 Tax=Natronomonas marina TaxID=2961939 RepID=UPI0020C9A483|nr:SDR family NAD(P)-dependent oxidoreductase [Natronomonas marina]
MLEDRVCIVCGGGGGIGEETAVALADTGATVVVNDLGVDVSGEGEDESAARQTVERIEREGGEAMAHFGDVTDLDYTERLVEETVAEYGAVHAVANFAGVLRDGMLFKMDESQWDAVVDVHLKGHFSLLRNAASHWRERYKAEGGFDVERSFVCVSSGVSVGNVGQANYSAAKAGVLGLMRTAALELDQYDVRVNAMWPTALTRMTEDLPGMAGVDEADMGPQHTTAVPVFLASEAAEGVTGCTLAIAGDNVAIVSDPERERTLSAEGEDGWTATELADRWAELTDGHETRRLSSGW